MGWQDRDYNGGREEMNAYFSNPAGLLQLSFPIYRSSSLYIRLHFWFVVFAVFEAIDVAHNQSPLYYIPIHIALMLLAVLIHEAGHFFFARRVGGNHWEWVVWPLGGMVPPSVPNRPWNVFVATVGGILVSAILSVAALVALKVTPGFSAAYVWKVDPFSPVLVGGVYTAQTASPALMATLANSLAYFCQLNIAITIINLFPAFWFDGGRLWQSILWPMSGLWRATRQVCMAGMALAVPCALLALWNEDFLGLVVWALIFSDCFNRRRALAAAGPGVLDEDDGPAYNYLDTPEHAPRKKKHKKRWLAAARKRALSDQAEQARIDAILAKVKEKGLHSLGWWEKRTLKKATERQRQRDLAERP